MATSTLLSHITRRSHHISAVNTSSLLTSPTASTSTSTATVYSHFPIPSNRNLLPASQFLPSRFFSSASSDDSNEFHFPTASSDDNNEFHFPTASSDDSNEFHFPTAVDIAEVAEGAATESALPVRTLISLLDYYHGVTGFPWWIVIASSTVVMRAALLPLAVLQLKKVQKISACYSKLPPPFPPPFSGRSFTDQLSLFREKKRALGCPSYLWPFAQAAVQMPCFLLWLTSIRKMCVDHHPGFDSGGVLWFQNLTELPLTSLGFLFPVLIACLHNMNVMLSFQRVSVQNMTDQLRLLANTYKYFLEFLTVPILFVSFCIPQGSLVFWFTNISFSAIQQISLRHPTVRAKLGLLDKDPPKAAPNCDETDSVESASPDPPSKSGLVSANDLSPKELVALSVKYLSDGHRETAIPLLQLALDKDPDYIMAMIVMGQTLLQKEWHAEATQILDHAISKLLLAGHPTDVENIDHLIVASQWAGVAYIRQAKNAEGLAHLERIACLKEPDDLKSKAHYFDGLVLLASALCNEGREGDAVKYLRAAAAYNPDYQELLEQCEKELPENVDKNSCQVK